MNQSLLATAKRQALCVEDRSVELFKRTLILWTLAIKIPVDQSLVWERIGKFDRLAWHPGVETASIRRGGLCRYLKRKDNSTLLVEDLHLVDDKGRTVESHITRGLPIDRVVSTLGVMAIKRGKKRTSKGPCCEVYWQAMLSDSYFEIAKVEQAVLEQVRTNLMAFYRQGLEALFAEFAGPGSQ